MTSFFDRVLERSADEEAAVRPRLDQWEPPEPAATSAWGEVVDEVPSPVVRRRARSLDAPPPPAEPAPRGSTESARGRDPDARPAEPSSNASPAAVVPEASVSVPSHRREPAGPAILPPPPSDTTSRRGARIVRAVAGHVPLAQAIAKPGSRIAAHRPTRPNLAATVRSTLQHQPAADRQALAVVAPRRQAAGAAMSPVADARLPDVVISIGRIEVRSAPAAQPARHAPTAPDTNRLDRYLDARIGRSSR